MLIAFNIGSLLFGIGWGIAGICPGPSIVLLGMGITKGGTFVVMMCCGMWLADRRTEAIEGTNKSFIDRIWVPFNRLPIHYRVRVS
ncbi:DUF6691 family protein [Undibacterium sp. Di24W]|uniref:DUF6691 family protein n=1 Tax=Undibacterium sp. Di24W TaxID=3413033 RepID=UPI003BF134AA